MPRIPLRRHGILPSRCLSYSNGLSVSTARSRLDRINNIHNSEGLLSTLKNVYLSENLNFLEEFLDNYTPEYKSLIGRLHGKEAIEYVHHDAVDLIIRGEQDKVRAAARLLQFPHNDGTSVHGLIKELVNRNRIAVAYECVIKLLVNNVEVKYGTIKMLNSALPYSDRVEFARIGYGTLQLVQHVEHLDWEERAKIIKFLTGSIHGNYFSNYLYLAWKKSGELDRLAEELPWLCDEILYRLLKVNCLNLNAYKCLEIWRANRGYIKPHNVSVLVRVMKLCDEQNLDALDILSSLPSTDTAVVNYKVEYFGKSDEHKLQFEDAMRLIARLERSTMTSLLASFINREDEENSEKIILTIFKSSGGINKTEMDFIVQKLLSQDKLAEARDMVVEKSWYDSQQAYVSIFKYVIAKQHLLKKEDTDSFWSDLRSRLKDVRSESVSGLLTVEILEHLTKEDAKLGISNYVKFISSSRSMLASNEMYLDIRLEKYGMPNWVRQYIRLSDKPTMLKACSTMLPYIVKSKDYLSIVWMFNEFRKFGWDLPSIYKLFKSHDDNDYLSTILKPKILNAITETM
ncbi:hypothetical protein Cantr_00917 [Candida viswanathii]|uniref:Uncharacterized protein n=1 Tax=Candida viswanathii TaxID=5486 RepID=A0A367YGK3_9ASCO|nr:hypothetical protein Cantr_00917 [Candida viswanathii]